LQQQGFFHLKQSANGRIYLKDFTFIIKRKDASGSSVKNIGHNDLSSLAKILINGFDGFFRFAHMRAMAGCF
jgi:hypothetical protein